jgi:TM2 domain-containing membrane protein YozV
MRKTLYISLMLCITMLAASCGSVSITQMRYKNGLNIGLCKVEDAKPSTQTKAAKSHLRGIAKNDYVASIVAQESPMNTVSSVLALPELKAPAVKATSVKSLKSKVHHNEVQNIASQSEPKPTQIQKADDNTQATQATHGSGKSQIVALVLAFFLGGLGIHRFYLGYTTIGIIQLLTAGGCGIWALIDFIRILLDDLKPMNGDYDETL